MLPSVAVSTIARRLGDRGTAFDTEIQLELASAQEEFESGGFLPWFLLVQATGTITGPASTLAVPTGYIMDSEWEGGLRIAGDGGQSQPIGKRPYAMLKDREPTYYANSGAPEAYAISGDNAYIFPSTAVDRAYEWWHFASAADLDFTLDTEEKWIKYAPQALIGKAGMELALTISHTEAYTIFERTFGRAWGALIARSTAREQANLTSEMTPTHG